MDERTQALLGPEPAPDPLAAKALDRRVEERDVPSEDDRAGRLRTGIEVAL